MIRALIVDDERLARNELRRLLAPYPTVSIVGEARSADEAAIHLISLEPDLLFLDIQMPGRDVFDWLAELERVPHVIFTTAYEQYAVRAFEVNALDYLLKPIEPARLQQAISDYSAPSRDAASIRRSGMLCSPRARMFIAALWSRSIVRPQPAQL